MPNNAIANYNRELEDKYKELQSIINTETKAERDYITKHPSQRDQYDIAFGRLNPESRAKADRFGSLVGEIQTINNNIVNLESAKNFFHNLYSQQRAETNSGFDKLQQSNALSNDIALSSALSTAGGMGASGIQSAGLKAQANNLLAATQQKAEAERQDALSKITQAEAQVPLQLANIGQINYQISKPETPVSVGRGGRGGGGGRQLPPSKGGNGNGSPSAELIAKYKEYGLIRNPEMKGWENPQGDIVTPEDRIKTNIKIDNKKNEELPKGYFFNSKGQVFFGVPKNSDKAKFYNPGELSIGIFGDSNKYPVRSYDYDSYMDKYDKLEKDLRKTITYSDADKGLNSSILDANSRYMNGYNKKADYITRINNAAALHQRKRLTEKDLKPLSK